MFYTDFEQKFLVGCYVIGQEQEDEKAKVSDVISRYGLQYRPKWLSQLLLAWKDANYAGWEHRREDADQGELGYRIQLTPYGLKEAERLIRENVVSLSTLEEFYADTDDLIKADSSKWTGRSLSTSERAEFVKNIDEALDRLDGLNLNQEKLSQARHFLRAVRELAEAPEPPFEVIHFLMMHIDRIIGIAGFFVGVAGLMVSVSQ